jgi:hypothetical protein
LELASNLCITLSGFSFVLLPYFFLPKQLPSTIRIAAHFA